MLNKWDLQTQEGSLDLLISAISSDLNEQRNSATPISSKLVKEMQEALDELRRKRSVQKLLVAIEENRPSIRKARRRATH